VSNPTKFDLREANMPPALLLVVFVLLVATVVIL
jgi:hypothetical protein